MENALWNERIVIASEIAKDYKLEKEIRKASGSGKLLCPDPECKNKKLKYCHGEVKGAYFAHVNNDLCNYAEFDKKNTTIVKTVRKKIYENFKRRGYNVKLEEKILPHHYTHLLLEKIDGRKVAIEIGTQKLSANYIDSLTTAYQKKGIKVNWIVIGDTNTLVREKHTFFMKRYLLNESKNKDLLVINKECSEVVQYKCDCNKYIYNGRAYFSENYLETYYEEETLNKLIIDKDNELTFLGFRTRYQNWLNKKQVAFEKKTKQLKADKKPQEELRHKRKKINNSVNNEKNIKSNESKLESKPTVSPKEPDMTYKQCLEEILPKIDQQEKQAYDSIGRRWIKCEECGRVDIVDNFVDYGGRKRINLGICNKCDRENRK
jgi:competence CoiA-like predicted nuclease